MSGHNGFLRDHDVLGSNSKDGIIGGWWDFVDGVGSLNATVFCILGKNDCRKLHRHCYK